MQIVKLGGIGTHERRWFTGDGKNLAFTGTRITRVARAAESNKIASKTNSEIVQYQEQAKNINITYDIYARVTSKMKSDIVDKFEEFASL